MKKTRNIIIAAVLVLIVFLFMSAKIIDKGTEGQYTGVVAFDAKASSGSDWDKIAAEITGNAKDVSDIDSASLSKGAAIKLKGTVTDFISKANGKRNSLIVVPDGYTGNLKFSVQLGSIYSGTVVRDIQTLKKFGDFVNQTEWSQYAKALNSQVHDQVVTPLKIDESIKGKTVNLIGAATESNNEVSITPVAMSIE